MPWARRGEGKGVERNGCNPQEGMFGDVVVKAWVVASLRGCQEGRKGYQTPKIRRWVQALELTSSVPFFIPSLGLNFPSAKCRWSQRALL